MPWPVLTRHRLISSVWNVRLGCPVLLQWQCSCCLLACWRGAALIGALPRAVCGGALRHHSACYHWRSGASISNPATVVCVATTTCRYRHRRWALRPPRRNCMCSLVRATGKPCRCASQKASWITHCMRCARRPVITSRPVTCAVPSTAFKWSICRRSTRCASPTPIRHGPACHRVCRRWAATLVR